MEDRRARMSDDDKLNMNEANLKNYIGTNIDHKHPSEVYGYGVPGLGMSYDRKQLRGCIDRNLYFTKTLSTNAQAQHQGDQLIEAQRRTNPAVSAAGLSSLCEVWTRPVRVREVVVLHRLARLLPGFVRVDRSEGPGAGRRLVVSAVD